MKLLLLLLLFLWLTRRDAHTVVVCIRLVGGDHSRDCGAGGRARLAVVVFGTDLIIVIRCLVVANIVVAVLFWLLLLLLLLSILVLLFLIVEEAFLLWPRRQWWDERRRAAHARRVHEKPVEHVELILVGLDVAHAILLAYELVDAV